MGRVNHVHLWRWVLDRYRGGVCFAKFSPKESRPKEGRIKLRRDATLINELCGPLIRRGFWLVVTRCLRCRETCKHESNLNVSGGEGNSYNVLIIVEPRRGGGRWMDGERASFTRFTLPLCGSVLLIVSKIIELFSTVFFFRVSLA